MVSSSFIELYKYQAEEECRYIREAQRQEIELAKAKGKYKGGQRKFKESDPRFQHGFKLFLSGSTDKEVEEKTGIDQRTFRCYR